MKNLKQVLALGMAFSLTMSTMAGAAFTDSADIKATEAVNMLNALGVITGYEDGSFKPDQTVSRAEAAKMIFSIRNNGSINADAFKNTPTTFTDISGHWAEGYIKYCQSMGIIAGKSATTFDPNGTVKGVELAKMILVTLGYDAEKAGIYGATWATKTLSLASENGLLDDVNSDLSAGLPRQYTAQMLYNGVNADIVTYVNGQYQKVETTKTEPVLAPDGTTWLMQTVTANKTMGNAYMDLTTSTVLLKDVSYDDVKGTYTLDTTTGTTFTKVGEDYSDLVGQKVNVLHKTNKNDQVYGVYAHEDTSVVLNATAGDVDNVSGTKIKYDGTEYKVNNDSVAGVNVYTIGNDVFVTPYNTLAGVLSGSADDAYDLKFIDNNSDDKIDLAIISPFTVAKVTYAGSKSITAGASYSFEDDKIEEGIVKDEYVKIVDKKYTVSGKNEISKLDTVEGQVTARKNNDVQVNGTWYKDKSSVTPNVGDTVKLSISGSYYYNSETISGKSLDNVVMVLKARRLTDGLASGAEADIMYAKDGSVVKNVKISEVDGGSVSVDSSASPVYGTSGNIVDGAMYTYVEKNGSLELTKLGNDIVGNYDFSGAIAGRYSDTALNSNTPGITDGTSTYAIADDAIVMVYTSNDGTGDTDSKFITGAELKKWSGTFGTSAQVLYDTINGVKTAKAIVLYGATAIPGASTSTGYGYVTDDSYYTEIDGNKYAVMTIWTADGEMKEVKAESYTASGTTPTAGAMTSAPFTKGSFVTFEKMGNGNIEKVTALTSTNAAIEGMYVDKDGNTVLNTDADTTAYTINSDTKVVYVDTDKQIGVDGGSISLATELEGAYVKNVVIYDKPSADYKLEVIFVDVTNNLASNTSGVTSGGSYTVDPADNKVSAAGNTGNTIVANVVANWTGVISAKVSTAAGVDVTGTAAVAGDILTVYAQDGTAYNYTIK